MKKLTRTLLVLALGALLVLGLVACNGDEAEVAPETPVEDVATSETTSEEQEDEDEQEPEEQDEEEEYVEEVAENNSVIGTWTDGDYFQYEFFEDNTGLRGGLLPNGTLDLEIFVWEHDEASGRMIIQFPESREAWSFAIVNHVLAIESRQVPGMSFTYAMLEQEWLVGNLLPGVWSWDDDPGFIYAFDIGGHGVRGTEEDAEEFYWDLLEVIGNDFAYLYLGFMDGRIEMWAFAIVDDVLTLSSREVAGMTFSYFREEYINFSLGYSLLGVWTWFVEDTLMNYDILFYADGTGFRGSEGLIQDFYWEADETTAALYIHIHGREEVWDVSIEGDVITFVSALDSSLVFSYTRSE